MILDGRQIAQEMKEGLKEKVVVLERGPVLAVLVVGEDPVIESFISIKKKFAEYIGVHIEEHRFSDSITTDRLLAKVEDLAMDDSVDGIVVQLPLPKNVEVESILNAIPNEKDVDVLSRQSIARFESGEFGSVPPVLGAIQEIVERESIEVEDKKVVVVGKGALVGAPVIHWFKKQNANVMALGSSDDIVACTSDADIIVLGAGSPELLKPHMIKKGVVVLDAGTSTSKKKLKGDADIACADKCIIFTPVPGGIGPITVAVLMRNLINTASAY